MTKKSQLLRVIDSSIKQLKNGTWTGSMDTCAICKLFLFDCNSCILEPCYKTTYYPTIKNELEQISLDIAPAKISIKDKIRIVNALITIKNYIYYLDAKYIKDALNNNEAEFIKIRKKCIRLLGGIDDKYIYKYKIKE